MPTALETRLVVAARELLDESGIGAVTIREVARRCGVSHGAPRRHFPTLALLLARLAGDVADELGEAARSAEQTPAALAATYVAYAEAHPNAFELLTRHDLVAGSGFDLRRHTLPLLATWVEAYLADRPTGSVDRLDALAAWAAVHGVASLAARDALEVADVDAAALLARIVPPSG